MELCKRIINIEPGWLKSKEGGRGTCDYEALLRDWAEPKGEQTGQRN